MKGVQCYELFGGIALKNHTFSFFIFIWQHPSVLCLFNAMNSPVKEAKNYLRRQ